MKKIPISNSDLSGNERKYLNECISTNWVSSLGKYVFQFEKMFSEYLNVKHCLTCSNGTAALHLALLALDIREGDEVIVPSFTFIATVNSILYCGAKPVFVDIDPITWCLDTNDVEKKITPKTKAILAVHIYGNPADMKELQDIAKKNNLFLIEDCAEALGATYDGNYVGSFGNVSTFSFYGNKIITCGEGGIVCTNNNKIYEKVKMLRDHAMSPQKRYYHEMIGYNYRMTNLQAAVGVAQLERIEYFLNERKRIFNTYSEKLKDLKGIQLPFKGNEVKKPMNWLYTIILKENNREELIKYLNENNIDTRPVFYPIHKMPYINSPKYLAVTEKVSKLGVSLPTYVDLSEDDIVNITKCIKRYFTNNTNNST